jgi:hypothetical protein
MDDEVVEVRLETVRRPPFRHRPFLVQKRGGKSADTVALPDHDATVLEPRRLHDGQHR